jgi:hypothetical protein
VTPFEIARECLEAKGAILRCDTCRGAYLSSDQEATRLARTEAETRRRAGEFGELRTEEVERAIDLAIHATPTSCSCPR